MGLRVAAEARVRTGKRIQREVHDAKMTGPKLLGHEHASDLAVAQLTAAPWGLAVNFNANCGRKAGRGQQDDCAIISPESGQEITLICVGKYSRRVSGSGGPVREKPAAPLFMNCDTPSISDTCWRFGS